MLYFCTFLISSPKSSQIEKLQGINCCPTTSKSSLNGNKIAKWKLPLSVRPLTTAYFRHVKSCIWVRKRNIPRPRTSGTTWSCTCCSGRHHEARDDRGQIDTEIEMWKVQLVLHEFKDFWKHEWIWTLDVAGIRVMSLHWGFDIWTHCCKHWVFSIEYSWVDH